ncbi:MAG: acyloxyacyl hydrolase [Ancalomicrobiaceae bacterium]|nr:acyloxyacyl hydrolase [Ancalomicrobiaceae bacterium]
MLTAKTVLTALALAVGAASGATQVWAGDTIDDGFRLFDELRLGAYAHNPRPRVTNLDKEISGTDLSVEILTSPLGKGGTGNVFYDFFLSPRAHVGTMISTNGHNSYVFAGVTWRLKVIGGLYIEPEFGLAANNGPDHYETNRTWLGSPVTFREAFGIGYQLTDHIDITANIEHISHAQIFNEWNPGQTNWGARLGYKF